MNNRSEIIRSHTEKVVKEAGKIEKEKKRRNKDKEEKEEGKEGKKWFWR